MHTRYEGINEAYAPSNETVSAIAIAVALIAGTLLAVIAINAVDNYLTGGFVALAAAICVSFGTAAAVATIARWILVRNAVSNSNLARNNGDAIFKFLGLSTVICFGVAASAMALQIFEVNLANELVSVFFHVKTIVAGVVSLVVDVTNVNSM